MKNPDLQLPYGYGTQQRTLGDTNDWLLKHFHPEYVARLIGWLESKGGHIGVGSGWRSDGTQPGKPGFAPEGKSFHQNQQYSDGFIGATAVDLVARAGGNKTHRSTWWSEVPAQGSADARTWGVHVNVGRAPSGEPWHMQPIEIDGWTSWRNNGSPAPVAGYAFPGRGEAPTEPPAPVEPPPHPDNPYNPPAGLYGNWYNVDLPTMSTTKNNKGSHVTLLQDVLKYETGQTIDVDGHYGNRTKAAVQNLQRWNKLEADGIAGPKTEEVVKLLIQQAPGKR